MTLTTYVPDGLTHLRDNIIAAVSILCGRAAEVMEQTGTPPKNILVVLSDGADRGSKASIAEVRKIVAALDPQMFSLGFIFFETWEDVDGKAMASELGFPGALDIKANPGETQEDLERRFRKAFALTSQSIVGKVQSLSTGMINQSGVGLFD